MSKEIVVPTLGESVTEATVSQWYKSVGDHVDADEPIVELETDKVTVEVNASSSGTIGEIKVDAGENVEVGAILGLISEGAAPSNGTATPKEETTPIEVKQPVAETSAETNPPSVRKLLEENNLQADQVAATGKDGRLTKGDVLNHLSKPAAPAPAAPQPQAPLAPRADDPREERVRMTRLRQKIAVRLKEAQNTAAMLTTFNEIDMTNVMALRAEYKEVFAKKHNVKLGFMSFFVKAVIMALKEIPAINAEIHGDEIIYKNYYDIGVAVGTEQGLVVPVVRDADKLSLAGVEAGINSLAVKARDGKLSIQDLTGGTFTITNGGVYGSLMSTPILNPPQSGILGMHKIQKRPIEVNGAMEIRPMMYTALSYDHRIVDGREAVTFLVRVKECLEDPQRLLLEI